MSELKPPSGNTASASNPRRQLVHLYDTRAACELLDGLTLALQSGVDSESNVVDVTSDLPVTSTAVISDRMTCTSCGCTFDDRKQQKKHYKSDWHRFNLKQRLKGTTSLSEEQFESVAGDVSSISGSASENDSSDGEDKSTSSVSPVLSDRVRSESPRNRQIDGVSGRDHRAFFVNAKGELVSVYKCVLHGKDKPVGCDLARVAQSLTLDLRWAVLMAGGGHFAAAIFSGGEMTNHKTFHRYVVRAKRGTAQSVRDGHGNAPKSAGATLRRYNEAALTQEIQSLLASWAEPLAHCSAIYLRAPSFNRSIFFGGRDPPLTRADPRVRTVPFQTRRATFSEVKRVHSQLTLVMCHGSDFKLPEPPRPCTPPSLSERQTKPSVIKVDSRKKEGGVRETPGEKAEEREGGTSTPGKAPSHKKTKNRGKNEEQNVNGHDGNSSDPERTRIENQLYTACRTADLDLLRRSLGDLALRERLGQSEERIAAPCERPEAKMEDEDSEAERKEGRNSRSEEVADEAPDDEGNEKTTTLPVAPSTSAINVTFGRGRSLLHMAASEGHAEVVSALLKSGADPSLRDANGQPPYLLASTKATRNAFRQFVGQFPDSSNFAETQIPAPLSGEREAEKRSKQLERKRAQRKVRRGKQKETREEEERERRDLEEKQRYVKLSDREKRALAAEKRLVSQFQDQNKEYVCLSRCWQCGTDLTGKVPFEYFDFRFCSTACLKGHRQGAAQARS